MKFLKQAKYNCIVKSNCTVIISKIYTCSIQDAKAADHIFKVIVGQTAKILKKKKRRKRNTKQAEKSK